MTRKKNSARKILSVLSILLMAAGALFLLLIILAFTTLPYHAFHKLGTSRAGTVSSPAAIVMLGGAGIPSGDGLMRIWYTAGLSQNYPGAEVIISIPGDTADPSDAPALARSELMLRGVPLQKIRFENEGRNTRQQALKLSALSGKPVLLVTSPEHMKRAVLAFRKSGFTRVGGVPAFEQVLGADLTFSDRELKGNRLAPPIGRNLQLRYQFWTHLRYEVLVTKEWFALGYYKLRGWI